MTQSATHAAFHSRSYTKTHTQIAFLLALLHLLLAATFSVVNPLGEAPDEADHWAYTMHLANERSLPEGPQVTQSKHPPAYHASAAVFAFLGEPDFSFLRANPDISLDEWRTATTASPNFFIRTAEQSWPWTAGPLSFHLARLWTAILSAATVLAAYGFTRAAFPAWPGFGLAVAASVAFWPQFAFLGGALNNDTPVALWSTLALWGGFAIAQESGGFRARLRAGWWTPLALGLGLLTKLSAAAIWPVVALAVVLGCARAQRTRAWTPARLFNDIWQSRSRWFPLLFVVFGVALLIAAPWFWRNWMLYADPLGVELARQTIDERTTPWGWEETVWLLEGWFLSFWGKFGAVGHIPYPDWVYWGLGLLSLASLAGWAKAAIDHWRTRNSADAAEQASTTQPSTVPGTRALLLLVILAVAGGIWQYSLIALGTDQGRLLFPALVPIVILLLLGLRAWIPARIRPLTGTLFALVLCALTLYGLLGVLRPAYAPPHPPSRAELAALPPVEPVRFGELTLVAYQLEGQPVLYWQAATTPQTDWRTILRVIAEDGSLVWEWQRSPGYGRWSTDRWSPNTPVRDAYAVQWPEWAGSGSYLVEVGLYPFGNEPVLPQPGDEDAGEFGASDEADDSQHPYFYLGRLERIAPN